MSAFEPVAFVFKNRKTGQIVVAPNGRWREYHDNKEKWEHTATVNACLAIQYILSVPSKDRNRYLRSLTESK